MVGFETAGRGVRRRLVGRRLASGPGVVAALAYTWHAQAAVRTPLLDFGLLRIPTFMVSVVAGTLFRVGIGAVPFLLPLMLQLGFG